MAKEPFPFFLSKSRNLARWAVKLTVVVRDEHCVVKPSVTKFLIHPWTCPRPQGFEINSGQIVKYLLYFFTKTPKPASKVWES